MIDALKKDIDKSLRKFLGEIGKNYKLHLSSKILFDGMKDFLQRKGKRIRPLLFLVSYLGYTKRKKYSYEKLLKCSLSLELLHDFMLAHDDVIDSSELRRGKPTLHKVFNKKMKVSGDDELGPSLSIVAGDVIFALAIEAFLSFDEDLIRKERALMKFTETAAYTGIGEFIDVVDSARAIDKITRKNVFLNYTLKTAKYTFECPLLIGAILAGADEKEMEKLSALGIMLGQAFQIQDDVLDMFSSSSEIGKSVLSDINESKKTLLVWKAYKELSNADKRDFKKVMGKDKKTYKDLVKVRGLIKKSGADKYCLGKAFNLLQESTRICSGLKMRSEHRKVVEDFINKIFLKTDSLRKIL